MFSSLRANRRCPFLFAHRRGYGVVPAAGAATFPPPAGGASLAEVQRKLSAPSGRTCLRSSCAPAFRCRKKLPPVKGEPPAQFVRPGQSVQKKGVPPVKGEPHERFVHPVKRAPAIKIPKGESPCHRLMTASSSSRASARKGEAARKLHIRTLRDALETYPRDYEDRTHITPIAEIDMEDKYAVRAVVGTEPKVNRIRKGLTLVKCTIYDETGTLNVTYFNNPYAAAQLRVGQEYVFYGKVQGFGRGRTMVSPQSEKVAPDADHPGRIVPVYSLTAGLTQRDLERVTAAALDTLTGEWPDPLPELCGRNTVCRTQ